ncbi:translocation/assembly module TamB domain-containing protein [Negadavirga shengliensis]|uniref:Translocation/assembly module TamB domain-containing protein n=1 Tax=Negadavirga shengliensis TaxID=1389218 RepID=A0ABV9T2L9_9BACT
MASAKKIFKKFLKVLGWILLSLLLLIVSLILLVRSPWGQELIVRKATSYVADKTGTRVEIDRLFITFRGDLFLQGLYLEDETGDTLVYSDRLETGVKILPLIKEGAIHISRLEWEGLTANVERDEEGGFNFDFLLKAFASPDSPQPTQEEKIGEDETSTMDMSIGPVRLSRFNLRYTDAYMGLDAAFLLGVLELDMGTLDLDKMNYHVEHFYFADSEIRYKQSKPFPPSEEESADGPLPLVVIDDFLLENIQVSYEAEPDNLLASLSLGQFFVKVPEADLESQRVLVEGLGLKDSEITYQALSESPGQTSAPEGSSSPFSWPDWVVELGQLDIENVGLVMKTEMAEPRSGYFNPSAMAFQELNLRSNNIYLKGEKAGMALEEFSFREASGFRLDHFSYAVTADDSRISLKNLDLNTGYSSIQGQLELDYQSLSDFIQSPEKTSFEVELTKISLDLRDGFFFAPELEQDPYVAAAAKSPVTAQIKTGGTLDSLRLEGLEMNWGEDTFLEVEGNIQHAMDMDQLAWDIFRLRFSSVKTDFQDFVSEEELGIALPEDLFLEGITSGHPDDFQAKVSLLSFGAEINLNGGFRRADKLAFEAALEVNQLPLGEILQNPDLGMLTFALEADGEGNDIDDLNARLVSSFEQLELYGYDYNGLELSGSLTEGKGEVDLAFQNDNLDMTLHSTMALDSANSQIHAELDLKGADFFALNLSPNDLRASFKLLVDWEGNPEAFDLGSKLEEGIVVFEERPYPIGDFLLNLKVDPDSTRMKLNSAILDGELAANASPENMIAGFSRHFNRYFSDTVAMAEDEPVELNFHMTIEPSPLLHEVLLPGLERLDPGSMEINFREAEKELTGRIDFPFISYNEIDIDSLHVRVRSDEEEMAFALVLVGLESGPLSVGRTYLRGEVEEDVFYMDFNSKDGEENLMNVSFDLRFEEDTVNLHVNPDNLILNKRDWEIPQNNLVTYAPQYLHFTDFVLSRSNQQLTFSNEAEGIEEEHVAVLFRDFRLGTLTSILNPEELIATGFVNGKLVAENPFGATGIIADLTVDEMTLLDTQLGNLALNAQSTGDRSYDFGMYLKDGGIDLDLEGDFLADEGGARLNLSLDLNELQMKVVEGLSLGAISNAEGAISGNFDVQGTTSAPHYEGEFKFDDAVFTVSAINSRYRLSGQQLKLDNEGVYFNDFTINDQDDNQFRLDGAVLTDDLANPAFDLTLTAQNFRVLNSTREDNDLFYGNATIDADIQIGGDMTLPVVKGRLSVKSGTDLTFIIPESQLDLVERDGVVLFVNREDPDDILTRRELEMTTSGFTGLQVAAMLNVDPNAVFNVVVDERSGDNLQVAGEADLNLNMDPNGRITLSGSYELRKGHYEMSLYQLVSRRFDIQEGSTITWGGDPMDANLNLTAIYRVKTSASELMAASAAGLSREGMTQYRQELPFLVYLNIRGELIRPEISFQLDMPEEQRGALGGNVYSQVQQLNNQEGELNRQVFSLLVLNRFFPDSGSDGGGGGTAALARSSVSQLLSGQLNALSDNLLGESGVELDFDLDSYRDYQGAAPQDRTQLNLSARKRFFDDRLVVQVGSQIDIEGSSQAQGMDRGNALLGNVSIEYLLTENGRYRLRGFRRNQFESFIDGQLVVTGMSVIFNREFNQFYELWRGIETRRNGGFLPPDLNQKPEDGKKQNEKTKKEEDDNED